MIIFFNKAFAWFVLTVSALLTLVLALAALGVCSQAHATEIYENWVSARAAGMGNAYGGLVSDVDALFYNPAAVDKIHGLHLTLLGINAGTDAQNAYTTLVNATGSSYATLINQFFGQEVWAHINDQLSLSMHDIAFTAYDNFDLSFDLHNPAYPNLYLNVANDVGVAVGVATSLAQNDAVRAGAVFKRVTRYGGRVPFGPSVIATLNNSQLTSQLSNYGIGYGIDGGVTIELPAPSKPAFYGVWQDIGQTKFNPASGSAPPPALDNLIVGYAMDIDAFALHIRPDFEVRHLTLWNEQLGKRVNAGVELAFPVLTLRAGANQGYYTAGVGVNFGYMRVDAATYGVELDDYPGQREDRRYIAQFTVDLNFDPGAGSGAGGSGGSGNSGSGSSSVKTYYRR